MEANWRRYITLIDDHPALVLVDIEIEKWFSRRGDHAQTISQEGNTGG